MSDTTRKVKNMSLIGSRLKMIRKHVSLTQLNMARILDCSLAMYKRYEAGETDIPATKLSGLKEYYKIDIDWLFSGQGEMIDNSDIIALQNEFLATITPKTPNEDADKNINDDMISDDIEYYKMRTLELEQENKRLKSDLEKMDDLIMRMGERMRDRLDRLKD